MVWRGWEIPGCNFILFYFVKAPLLTCRDSVEWRMFGQQVTTDDRQMRDGKGSKMEIPVHDMPEHAIEMTR